MLFRLLASAQSGIIPDEGRRDKPDKPDSRTRDLCLSFSNRDSQRLGNYLWISLARPHSTGQMSALTPHSRSPRGTAHISLDSTCLGLSIPSHGAAFPRLPCRLVTLSLCRLECRSFGLDAFECTGCTQIHSDAFRCTWDHHPKVTGVLCIA